MSSLASTVELDSSVLVLNKNFLALAVIGVRRAFCMLVSNHAEVIEEQDGAYCNYDFHSWQDLSSLRQQFPKQDDAFISTVNQKILVPQIIRLHRYNRPPRMGVPLNRRNIFARDSHQCQYCGCKVPSTELSIDHVTPRAQGGRTSWDNVVCACISCNIRKGGRTPHQAAMELIRDPIQPKTSPLIFNRLKESRYQSWMAFLDEAYWTVNLDQ